MALFGAAAAWASVDETTLAARLAADASELLEQLLGPGRAKVFVTLQGERTEIRTESEITTPQPLETNASLPGYLGDSELKRKVEIMQKDHEQSLRSSGLLIKNITASVVLDESLSDDQVQLVRRLLPDLMRLDARRGDSVAYLRAPLIPSWRRAFLGTEGTRTLVWLGGGVLLVCWMGLVAYLVSVGVMRHLTAELALRRADTGGAAIPLARAQGPDAALAAGGPVDVEAELFGEPPRRQGQLGRRFDFLAAKDPQDLAGLLDKESPEDLALLFGYLADSSPEVATRLFGAFPARQKAQVSQALARLTTADPERLAMLESRLKTTLEFGLRGPERLGRILSRLPSEEREEVLGELMAQDASSAEQVESTLFRFERIGDLAVNDLRRLLTAVSYPDWGVALRGMPEKTVARIAELLPREARDVLRDAMSVPLPREKVLEARSKILSQAYALERQGQISLGQRRASSELI